MSEDDWFDLSEPVPALAYVRTSTSIRKYRLFALACWNRVRSYFQFNEAWKGFRLVDQVTEGQITESSVEQYRNGLAERAFWWIDCYREERENNCRCDLLHAIRDSLESTNSFLGTPEPSVHYHNFGGR